VTEAAAIERRDEHGKPPAIWMLALRVGPLFGLLLGVFRAIVVYLRTTSAARAFEAGGRAAVVAAISVGVLYAVALRVAVGRGARLASTEQRAILRVRLSAARAFAVALKALRSIDDPVHDADLVTGTASVETRTKEVFFGLLRLRLGVSVKPAGTEGAEIVIESRGINGAIDFGASRRLVDDLAQRIEDAIASGRAAPDAVGLDAIPKAARAMFQKNGYRVVGLRSLRREAPAVSVNLLAEGDAAATAVVLTLPRPVSEAVLRTAAERAQSGGAAGARVGEGFAIIPLVAGETPAKVASRVHQLLLDDASGRGAKKNDEKDPASTSRMKFPRR
jgi:hypothetical protein